MNLLTDIPDEIHNLFSIQNVLIIPSLAFTFEHAISGESNNPGLHCHFDVPSLVHLLSVQISSDLHSSSNLQIPRKFEINLWHLDITEKIACLFNNFMSVVCIGIHCGV